MVMIQLTVGVLELCMTEPVLTVKFFPTVLVPIGEAFARIGRDVLGSAAMGTHRLPVPSCLFEPCNAPFFG